MVLVHEFIGKIMKFQVSSILTNFYNLKRYNRQFGGDEHDPAIRFGVLSKNFVTIGQKIQKISKFFYLHS